VATTGEGEPTEPGTGHGSGGGGGAGGRAKPRGYIRIADGEVTYEPIVDQGRLAIAGLLTAAWFVFWVTKTVRTFAKS